MVSPRGAARGNKFSKIILRLCHILHLRVNWPLRNATSTGALISIQNSSTISYFDPFYTTYPGHTYREISQYFIFDTILTQIWVRCITLVTMSYSPLPCCVTSLSYSTKQGETTAAEISRTPGSGSLEVYTRSLASRSPLRSRVLSLPRLILISRARTLSSFTALAIYLFLHKEFLSFARGHVPACTKMSQTHIRSNRRFEYIVLRTWMCHNTRMNVLRHAFDS